MPDCVEYGWYRKMTQVNLYRILDEYDKKGRLEFKFVQPFYCDYIPFITDLWDITDENRWQLDFVKFVPVRLPGGYPKEVIAYTKSEIYLLRIINNENSIGKKFKHKFDLQRKKALTKSKITGRRKRSMFIDELESMGIPLQVKEPKLPEKKKRIISSVCSKHSKNLDRITP